MKNNGLAFLAIAAGVAMFAFGKKGPKTGLPRPPKTRVPTGPPRNRREKLNTAIGQAKVKGLNYAQRIIDKYPARPGAAAGAPSFAHDWGGQEALDKTVGHWIPILKKELRVRKSPDPFRARSATMLVLIDQFLAT